MNYIKQETEKNARTRTRTHYSQYVTTITETHSKSGKKHFFYFFFFILFLNFKVISQQNHILNTHVSSEFSGNATLLINLSRESCLQK